MGNSSKIVLTNWLKHKFIGVTLTAIVEKLRTIKKSINLRLNKILSWKSGKKAEVEQHMGSSYRTQSHIICRCIFTVVSRPLHKFTL